jgi:Tfp pilus assembly PilM family ATPase
MPDVYHLGVNFTENFIQIVELKKHGNKNYVSCLDEIESDIDFNSDILDLIRKPNSAFSIVENVSKLLKRNKLNSKHISVSLSASSLFMIHLPIDSRLDELELKEHLDWEISNLFPGEPSSSFNIATCPLNSSHGIKNILVVVIRKEIVNFFKYLFNQFNLDAVVFDIDHFAVIKALVMNYPEIVNENIVLIGYRNGYLDYSVLENGSLVDYKFKKLLGGENHYSNLSSQILSFVDRNIVSSWFLYGKAIRHDLVTSLRNHLSGVRVESINPFRRLDIDSNLNRRQELMMDRLYFTPAVGLAIKN